MTWLLIVSGAIVGLVALVIGIGLLLPQNHTASRTARFAQSPEAVWQAITDHAAEPAWRSDIVSKERLEDRNGHAVWRETSKRGESMSFEIVAFEPPRRMIGRIADDNLPFGGTWTYEITAVDGGDACTLTITENGEIYNPVFRFVAKFIIGYRGTMDRYLSSLSRKFGQEAAFVD